MFPLINANLDTRCRSDNPLRTLMLLQKLQRCFWLSNFFLLMTLWKITIFNKYRHRGLGLATC